MVIEEKDMSEHVHNMNLEFHKMSHELYNYVDDTIMIITIINNDNAYSEMKDVE